MDGVKTDTGEKNETRCGLKSTLPGVRTSCGNQENRILVRTDHDRVIEVASVTRMGIYFTHPWGIGMLGRCLACSALNFQVTTLMLMHAGAAVDLIYCLV